ncbi:hypothetical protein LCGC14_1909450 [marine sediment metagenome]|uniref:Uncharacterized protein n=1 Tax=marine sediment metagenome TaxID=412755 RepID=A0A0F9FU46_9ZZZZ
MKKKSKLIEYTNILHAHGLGSKQARKFKQTHKDDKVFQRGADTIEGGVIVKDIDSTGKSVLVIGILCVVVAFVMLIFVLI